MKGINHLDGAVEFYVEVERDIIQEPHQFPEWRNQLLGLVIEIQ